MRIGILSLSVLLLSGCMGPVKVKPIEHYTLEPVYIEKMHARSGSVLIIPAPQVDKGLQSNDMLYSMKEFQINAYTYSKWTSAPSSLLHKILLDSFNRSGIYKAVISSSYSKAANWKLEIRILDWHQSFLCHPSKIVVSYIANIYDIRRQKIVASRVFETSIRTRSEDAYGGVVAMNYAMDYLIPATIKFVRNNTR